jgi:haloacetate dehalogenase
LFKNFKKKFQKVNKGKIFYRIGGSGAPLLLLHGYPQNHYMWHKIADRLSKKFTVISPDLRGYGQSFVISGDDRHLNYSKREMAKDMVQLMSKIGYKKFLLAGHDRGGRVAHRLARDFRDKVIALSVLDICPTLDMYNATDQDFATNYFHWFFLIQPKYVPENLIAQDPKAWLNYCLKKWSGGFNFKGFEKYYLKYFKNYKRIHSSCEDYRAGATIDLEHDKKDLNKKLNIPLQVLWGKKGRIGRKFKPLKVWQKYTSRKVEGKGFNCKHFIAEEASEQTLQQLQKFFSKYDSFNY